MNQVRALSTNHGSNRFEVVLAAQAEGLERETSPRYNFRVPSAWICNAFHNPSAAAAQPQILEWFRSLGCSPTEVERVGRFDAAGYVGIPFPRLSPEQTLSVGKYLSLWLLWDDVHVESREARWKIRAEHVLSGRRPPDMSRFDEGWWQLLRELATSRSPRWIEALCEAMSVWDEAATQEAVAMQAFRERGTCPPFARQVEMRMATIGMYATVYLLEDAYDQELPPEVHAHPSVVRMKDLASKIVGIGNDILSFGKDFMEGQINLLTTLMQQGMSGPRAIERLIRLCDEALIEYDGLAADLGSYGPEVDAVLQRWLQDVRYAALGFTLWEAQAPRYTAFKIVADGKVIEPGFLCVP